MKRIFPVFLFIVVIFSTINLMANFNKKGEVKYNRLNDDCGMNQFDSDSFQFVFSCSPENDLFRILKELDIPCIRYDTPIEAIQEAHEGGGVLLLADNYPDQTQTIPQDIFVLAAKKCLKLYIEYPAMLPDAELEKPQKAVLERGVITSGIFGVGLRPMEIVTINDCHFVPMEASTPYITLATVVGFNKAGYGLPKDVWPILFEHSNGKMLISTTKLSQFVTARYAPTDSWNAIWRMILDWVQPNIKIQGLKWTPVVYPSYTREEPLPSDIERQTIRRGLEWVLKAHMLIHPSWKEKEWGKETQHQPNLINLPIGDGSEGIIEGFQSKINYDGSQPMQWRLRSDCSGEQATSFVLGGQLLNETEWIKIGKNLHDFALFKFNATTSWNDPKHPAFGLIDFYSHIDNSKFAESFYGAINARICMGALTSAAILNEERWDDRVLQVILANYRTTGQYGLRNGSLSLQALEKNGWKYYYDQSNLDLSPYGASQLLAMNLAIYKITGYQPLLDKTKQALKLFMQAYPDKWKFYNGMQQDRARMLLPLAWLVQADDTPEHREWLVFMTNEFIKYQDNCGAIPEELGRPGMGRFKEQRSNDTYGISETSIIYNNGDPGCDLLYTLSSGFVGLHEAVVVTGNPEFLKAEDRLSQFLCRIQTRSNTIPELDGTWFRAFDFDRWEYWGSDGDDQWGAWCSETGWIQGALVTTLALRQMNTSLWSLVVKRSLKSHLESNIIKLFPNEEDSKDNN